MITPWQMYWLLKLDEIQKYSLMSGVLLAVILGISTLAIISEENFDKRFLFITLPGFVFSVLLFVFGIMVPSTKQMAAIVVLPAIVNNEKVQEMGGKTLDIGNGLLDLTKQYLEENLKEN